MRACEHGCFVRFTAATDAPAGCTLTTGWTALVQRQLSALAGGSVDTVTRIWILQKLLQRACAVSAGLNLYLVPEGAQDCPTERLATAACVLRTVKTCKGPSFASGPRKACKTILSFIKVAHRIWTAVQCTLQRLLKFRDRAILRASRAINSL